MKKLLLIIFTICYAFSGYSDNAANIYNNLGVAKYRTGDFDGSLDDFNTSIYIDSTISHHFGNRGIVKLKLNDFRGAMTDFNKAVELNPASIDTYFNRGSAQLTAGKYATAISDFNFIPKFAMSYK